MNNDLTLWEERNSTEQMKKNENSGETVKTDSTSDTKIDSTKTVLTDTTKISGIYKIVNKVNGKYYVGSSINIFGRWSVHKSHLKRNKHRNPKLQSAYNKYGKDSFEFVIKEEVSPAELFKREQFYLDECRSNPEISYNLTFIAGGVEMTDEVRRKLSFKARNRSESTKKKMGAAHKGKILSESTKKKIGDGQRGRKRSEETRRRMSVTLKGYIRPPAKESTKQLHSLNMKERFKDVNYRNKMISYLRPGKSGLESPNTDFTEYTFKHLSGEVFKGNRFSFYNTRPEILPLGVHRLVHKTSKSYKGWILVS